jgi:hypothetical protein
MALALALLDASVTVLPQWRMLFGRPRFTEHALLIGFVVVVTPVLAITLFGGEIRALLGTANTALSGQMNVTNFANAGTNNASSSPTGDYRGLPAKVVLPVGDRSSTFHSEMLDLDRANNVQVLMVGTWLVDLISLMLLVMALTLLLRQSGAWWAAVVRLYPARATPEALPPVPATA